MSTAQSVPVAWLTAAARLKLLRVALVLLVKRMTTGSPVLRMALAEFGRDASGIRAALSRLAGARLLTWSAEAGGVLAIHLTGSAAAR